MGGQTGSAWLPAANAASGVDSVTSAWPNAAIRSIQLVRQAQQGDLEALNRLFARYYERVRSIVRIRLGPMLRGVLESGDILQETFIGAVRGFERFELRDEASLINWLCKIAENQIRGAGRQATAQKRRRDLEQGLSHVQSSIASGRLRPEPVADLPPPIEMLVQDEQVRLLESCMQQLKDEYREVILQRNYAGASWEAVARLMQRPSANAARMLHSRAMIELTALVRREKGKE